MALLIKIGTDILDVGENPIALTSGRQSFLNIGSRQYGIIKGLKFPFTETNKRVFGFGDTAPATLTTVRSIFDVQINIDNIIDLVGNLIIKGNDKDNYIGTFTSRDSQIEALEGYNLNDAIALHTFPTATWNALANNQARINYITGNTDPAWVLPFVGATEHPYTFGGSSNIIAYSPLNGVSQDLHYNVGVALTEVFADAGITVLVYESGSEVALTSSNLYINVISNIFTPSWTWALKWNTPIIEPPTEDFHRETYSNVAGFGFQKDIILKTEIDKMAGKTMWETMVDLSKYLGFYIEVRSSDILLIPMAEILTNGLIDYTDKLVSARSKSYFIKGYEKANYIRSNTTDTTKKDFAQLTFNQSADFLKEEKTVFTNNNIVPGIYDFGGVTGFFKINWDSKYSKNTIFTFLDSGSTVSGWAEQVQGAIYRGVGENYATTFYKLAYYQPTAEFDIIQDILDEGVLIEAEFDMSTIDFKNLKPYSRIKVNQFGGEFIVEPFEFVKGKPTKLKLLKIA